MNSRQITSFVLLVTSIGFGGGCSDGTVAGRLPVNSGAGGTGGNANSGGTGGSTTGGKAATGGSGGAVATGGASNSGGASTGGTGGGASAAGGSLNLNNCDTATLALLFNQKKCDDCHFNATAFHTVTALDGWVGKMGLKTATMNCPNRTVVVPGNPQASLLYIKLVGAPPAGCGEQMPKPEGAQAFKAFSSAELKCVEDWINGLPAGSTGGGSGI